MGNASEKSVDFSSTIKSSVTKVKSTLQIKKASLRRSRAAKKPCNPCECELWKSTQHCCIQTCLANAEEYSHLPKLWLFTDEHVEYLKQVLIAVNLEYIAIIIREFLEGIASTCQEYCVFCHGLDDNIYVSNPCTTWLKSRTRHIHMEILGAKGVGKSCLALKCAKDMFCDDPVSLSAEQQRIYFKRILLSKVPLNIRITDGLMDGRIMCNPNESSPSHYDFIYILCVDPSSERYWDDLTRIQELQFDISKQYNVTNSCHDAVRSAFIIVATKCDLKSQKYITRSERVIIYCNNRNIPYIEVSAKNGINLDFFLRKCVYELWIQTQTHCSS